MMLRFLALVLLLAPVGSFTQTSKKSAKKAAAPAAQPDKYPIQSLLVEGNHNYTKQQILAVAALKIGQMAGKPDFDAARDRIQATGVFETVSYRFAPAPDGNGYVATFQVTEVGQVYPLIIQGLPIQLPDFNTGLKSKDPMYNGKLPGTAEALKRYAALTEEYLTSKNQPEKVVAKLGPTGVDQYGVILRSAKPIPTIAEVKFTGSKVIPATMLQNRIAEVAIGFPYSEDGFRGLLNNSIRPLYEARGRIAVNFPKITTEKAADNEGLVASVTVEEGEEYKLGEVRIVGDYARRSSELLRVGKFKPGEIVNFDEIASGVDRIKKPIERQGYMHASATVDRAINDKTKTVDISIRVVPGAQYMMGKLEIQGLDLNSTAGVRELWAPKEGAPFDAAYPDYFLGRVREEKMFDHLNDAKASTKIDDQNHTVDVTLVFR
jgi:outer membrane protein insertion porin family